MAAGALVYTFRMGARVRGATLEQEHFDVRPMTAAQ